MSGLQFLLLFSLLFCCLATLHAAEPPLPGKDKSTLCQHCHGVNGISDEPMIPKLAGQYRDYIIKQIFDFQIANRHNELMTPMAHAFDNIQDIRDIASFFASQPPMRGRRPNNLGMKLGKPIYENGLQERGVFACSGCHGKLAGNAQTNNSMFPVLAGQHRSYLIKQLLDFRDHRRQTDPSGIMHNISKSLTKKEIYAVAEYISGLN